MRVDLKLHFDDKIFVLGDYVLCLAHLPVEFNQQRLRVRQLS